MAADCDPKPCKRRAPTCSFFRLRTVLRRQSTAGGRKRLDFWQLKLSERRPRCTVRTSNISQPTETRECNKQVKIKVKVSLQHALKVQWRRRCIALLCPNNRARWRWTGQRHALTSSPPGRAPVPTGGGWVGRRADLDGVWRRDNPFP